MKNPNFKFKLQRIKNVYHLLNSVYWAVRCGFPAKKMTVVGVTGTDGKTTTCTVLYEVLKAAGYRAGVLTTVSAKFLGKNDKETEVGTGLHTTNPDARQLQPILAQMVRRGVTHLVLEVTAHGIDQYRIWGTNIQIGVLTNISREHLDDFVDMDRYMAVKAKMFEKARYAVLNAGDISFEYMKRRCGSKVRIVSYSKAGMVRVSPALAGEYNQENLGAVTAVAEILGISRKVVEKTAANFDGVAGRREEIKAGQKFRVIVDFAHTPNALEKILEQLKSELGGQGKLIVVFGCTGERDTGKRPLMGKIATKLADVVIVTSDDTRSENQDDIFAQIVEDIDDRESKVKTGELVKENDRRKAVELAVKTAKPGDIVLLAGKGHETSILIGKTERPWSDRDVALEMIKKFRSVGN